MIRVSYSTKHCDAGWPKPFGDSLVPEGTIVDQGGVYTALCDGDYLYFFSYNGEYGLEYIKCSNKSQARWSRNYPEKAVITFTQLEEHE